MTTAYVEVRPNLTGFLEALEASMQWFDDPDFRAEDGNGDAWPTAGHE
jgi:hypothetical protein